MDRNTHSRPARTTRPTPMLPKATTTPTPRLVAGVGAAFVVVAMLVLITHQLGAEPTPLVAPTRVATRAPAVVEQAPTQEHAPALAPLPTEPPAPVALPAPAPMTGQGATWQDAPAPEPPAVVEEAPAAPLACQNAPAPEGVPICEEPQPVFLREAVEDDCSAEHGRCSPPVECTAEHGRCTKGDGT